MTAPSASSFPEVVGRLDEIVEVVRSKGTSLEESLDLLDEAIRLGLEAVEMVDAPEGADAAAPAGDPASPAAPRA